jgi:predicted transcriptional regulator of viral defense system
MADYYAQFAKWRVFSHKQVVDLCGNAKTAETVLYSAKKKGLIQTVTRGLSAAISIETGEAIASPYEIASRITKDSYISHHTAFEYYGFANQVFSTVTVSSSVRFTPFEFDGRSYLYKQSYTSEGITISHGVRVTEPERTVIDNIKDFAKTAGLEELLRCLGMITVIQEQKLLGCLALYDNRFLYQKTGYILSHFKTTMKLTDTFFAECRSHIGKSVRYLYEEIKAEHPVYNKEWQLFVPADLLKIIDEGGSEIV